MCFAWERNCHLVLFLTNQFERIYQNECVVEYSEILFKPELKLTFMGKETSLIGLLDSKLTGQNKFLSLFARQASFFAVKNTSSRVEGSNST